MNESYKTRPTLISRVKDKHDDKSWEEFVHYYKQYIYLICRRMAMNHHDSEEVIQTVLIKLWDKLPDFEYDVDNKNKYFRGWLCRVTGNTVKDFYKKKNRSPVISESGAIEDAIQDLNKLPQIEEIAEQEWQVFITNLAFKEIKKQFAENVVEIFVELHQGKSRTEVAQKFKLPVNTISVYKKRVLAALCKEIRILEETIC